MQACALIVLALHCTRSIACSSGGGSPDSTQMPHVPPANVERIFKLPLRQPKVVYFIDASQVYARSVDFDHDPIGQCRNHQNSSITCWTEVAKAAFDIFAKVSALGHLLEIELFYLLVGWADTSRHPQEHWANNLCQPLHDSYLWTWKKYRHHPGRLLQIRSTKCDWLSSQALQQRNKQSESVLIQILYKTLRRSFSVTRVHSQFNIHFVWLTFNLH